MKKVFHSLNGIISEKLDKSNHPLIKKYKALILYSFFGIFTTVINIAAFWLFTNVIVIDVLIANAIAWVLAVLYAFLTNREWVFEKGENSSFYKELFKFFAGRFFTFIIEEVMILVFIKQMGLNEMLIKVIIQVIIVTLNYLISKFLVFKVKKMQ